MYDVGMTTGDRVLVVATQLTTRDPSRTPHQRAARSTVARKVLMSISGLIIVLFLMMHLFGNAKLLIPNVGFEEFDEYSHSLRTFLYPILPEKFFLTLFRLFMLAAAFIHIEAAIKLTFRNKGSGVSGARYLKQRYLAGSFAARTMIWSGIIIVFGVIAHLLQFTCEIIRVSYPEGVTTVAPHERVVLAFQTPVVVAAYAVWMLAVCIHVYHGFYSALCTIGARTGAYSEKLIKVCSVIVAFLVFFGFMAAPLSIAIGLVTL
ncbi:b558 family succinate dehydrogenase (or fumarate reductase) cytochrome B subunit [Propionibacterium sp. oral taxon 192 str. F0372]|nr:b558 family succinate dehydrogenase (or fumarate reductase) cytochrome B subunit [Propionibacterium sp. oral taxon 192 str. F0372]